MYKRQVICTADAKDARHFKVIDWAAAEIFADTNGEAFQAAENKEIEAVKALVGLSADLEKATTSPTVHAGQQGDDAKLETEEPGL